MNKKYDMKYIFIRGEMMKKVVVIGAGPAGLTAANELLKLKKYEVVILEETNDIGGIAKTVNYNGNRMDIGGNRFFSKDKKIINYWQDLMPIQGEPSYDDKKLEIDKKLSNEGPNPEKDDNVMLIRRRTSRILYSRKFFEYPISIKKETFRNIGIYMTFRAGISYLKANIFKRKEETLEDFYINSFGKVLYEMFFKKYTEKVWGRNPSEISADWGKQRAKGISITEILKDTLSKKIKKNREVKKSLIEEFLYPKLGPGQLWEVLADKIQKQGGKILRNYKVEKINVEDKVVKSVFCKVNNKIEEIKADIFISSMPIKDLVQGMEKDIVPKEMLKIANRITI